MWRYILYFQVPIWEDFQTAVNASTGGHVDMQKLDRFEFYERAKSAYAVVASGETAPYANIILKKGVIVQN